MYWCCQGYCGKAFPSRGILSLYLYLHCKSFGNTTQENIQDTKPETKHKAKIFKFSPNMYHKLETLDFGIITVINLPPIKWVYNKTCFSHFFSVISCLSPFLFTQLYLPMRYTTGFASQCPYIPSYLNFTLSMQSQSSYSQCHYIVDSLTHTHMHACTTHTHTLYNPSRNTTNNPLYIIHVRGP